MAAVGFASLHKKLEIIDAVVVQVKEEIMVEMKLLMRGRIDNLGLGRLRWASAPTPAAVAASAYKLSRW